MLVACNNGRRRCAAEREYDVGVVGFGQRGWRYATAGGDGRGDERRGRDLRGVGAGRGRGRDRRAGKGRTDRESDVSVPVVAVIVTAPVANTGTPLDALLSAPKPPLPVARYRSIRGQAGCREEDVVGAPPNVTVTLVSLTLVRRPAWPLPPT